MGEESEVKTINGYFKKQNIAARISVETVELIDENFELITGGQQTVTDRKLIECLIDLALSKVKPDAKTQKRIEDLIGMVDTLTIENGKLKSANDVLVGNNNELQGELNVLPSQNKVNMMCNEIDQLKNDKNVLYEEKARVEGELITLRQNSSIPEGAIIVILNDSEKKVIEQIALEETKRIGSEVTPSLLMKNVFFFVLVKGPHDMFQAPISIRKIREMMSAQS